MCYVPLERRPDVGKVHAVGDTSHRGLKATAGTWAIQRISGLRSTGLKRLERERRRENGTLSFTRRTKLEKLGPTHYHVLSTDTRGL